MTTTPATRISISAGVLGVAGKVTARNAGLVAPPVADASRFLQYVSRRVEMRFLRANPTALSAVPLNSSS